MGFSPSESDSAFRLLELAARFGGIDKTVERMVQDFNKEQRGRERERAVTKLRKMDITRRVDTTRCVVRGRKMGPGQFGLNLRSLLFFLFSRIRVGLIRMHGADEAAVDSRGGAYLTCCLASCHRVPSWEEHNFVGEEAPRQ